MERQDPKVVLTARDVAGEIVQRIELSSSEWYDGECPLIDSDEECRRLSVRSIEGYQTDPDGRIYRRWRITCDTEGRQEDSELVFDDWKPTIAPPLPGQSAADQLRRAGLLPGQRRRERQEDQQTEDQPQLDLEL